MWNLLKKFSWSIGSTLLGFGIGMLIPNYKWLAFVFVGFGIFLGIVNIWPSILNVCRKLHTKIRMKLKENWTKLLYILTRHKKPFTPIKTTTAKARIDVPTPTEIQLTKKIEELQNEVKKLQNLHKL
jgi:hypothetical protein